MDTALKLSTVRMATLEDIPRIVEMGKRFRSESPYSKHISENPEKMAETATTLLSKNGLLVLVRGNKLIGMLGFLIYDHFISGEKVSGEVFWWTEPEFRGDGLKLVDEAKRLSRLAGARSLDMVAPSERIARLYRILGYEWLESTHRIIL